MNTNTLRNRRTRRTTITLEADVADFIQESLRKDKNLKEKQLINKLLRAGIKNESKQTKVNFKIKGFKASLAEGVSADDLEKLLDEI
jgi:hypothetical protein